MPTRMQASKIQTEHLARQAYIYVRQSSLAQVRHNTASTARQYDLVKRAKELGWPESQIQVIDQDQGQSGRSAEHRDGFQQLVADVGLGRAGAVLSLEASRLARSSSDWHRLIEICSLSDTLVIDEEGVYDPSHYDDRLLLGFKGAMSEAELHWLQQRLVGGKLEKAQQGELRFRLPSGYVYDQLKRVVFDPDEQVHQAVQLVFKLFEETGSALAVVKHFTEHKLVFPTRCWGGLRDGELVWQPLSHSRVLAMLHNPRYAGAYVYGRTQTQTRLLLGEKARVKGRTRQVKRDDWQVIRRDAHPGYISWSQYQMNLQQLEDNQTSHHEDHRGVVREGAALLQGMVLCGKCGRRMTIRYLQDGQTPSYECNQLHKQRAGKTCQSMRGDAIDAAVAKVFLEAMQPAQLDISLATIDQLELKQQQLERQGQLRLERSQYEADLAKRRLMLVEPELRLVARSLEKDWNDKLSQLQQLEREVETSPQPAGLLNSTAQRQRILDLAKDLPLLWQASTTQQTERKQLLRFLIKDVTLSKHEQAIHVGIRWQTEAVTELTLPKPQPVYLQVRTSPAVMARIRSLTVDHTDSQMATCLNQEGFKSGKKQGFSSSKVQWIRHAYQIPSGCPQAPGACPTGQRGDGRYSAQAAAELLNVHVSTIAAWAKAGRLDALQEKPRGPRWIKLSPDLITELRKPVPQRRSNYVSQRKS